MTRLVLALPLLIFSALSVLVVYPRHRDARAAAEALKTAAGALAAVRSSDLRPAPASQVIAALAALLSGDAVGGVSNLSIVIGDSATVTFDARSSQVAAFLRLLPERAAQVRLRSLDIRSQGELVHATAILDVDGLSIARLTAPASAEAIHAPPAEIPRPQPRRTTPPPVPAVYGTLVSDDRRVALIEGRVLRIGDAVGGSVITAIDEASVELSSGSAARRIQLRRPNDVVVSR